MTNEKRETEKVEHLVSWGVSVGDGVTDDDAATEGATDDEADATTDAETDAATEAATDDEADATTEDETEGATEDETEGATDDETEGATDEGAAEGDGEPSHLKHVSCGIHELEQE